MKLNTKLLFLSLAFATILSSCKKDSSDDSEYYFKFKMNGNWITWKQALADLVTQSGQTEFALTARNDAANEYIYMVIDQNNNSFVPGTYTPDNTFLAVQYVKNISSTSFISYSDDAFGAPADTRYEITITTITDKNIKGTFKGNYLTNDENENDRLNITEGEFSLLRVR